MTELQKTFIYWLGRHNLRPGRKFNETYTPGKPPGTLTGHFEHIQLLFFI